MDERLRADYTSSAQPSPEPEGLLVSPEAAAKTPARIGLRWDKLRLLSGQLYPSHGTPTTLVCTPEWIIVGTKSAEILVFDWKQKLQHTLIPPQPGVYGQVNCIACNDNQIIAGYSLGHVISWDFKGILVLFAAPLDSAPPENTTENHLDGHVAGTQITWVALGNRTVFSGDANGIVFEHHNIRLLRRVRSQRLLGRHSARSCLLAAHALKLRGCHYICVLTPQAFLIYLAESPQGAHGIQFMLPRATENIDTSMGLSGALAWNQSSQMLAICWANVLRLVRLKQGIPGPVAGLLACTTERLWHCSETIVSVEYLTESTLAVLTITHTLIILDTFSLEILDSSDLKTQQPVHSDLYSQALQHSSDSVVADAYKCVQTNGLSLVVLGRYEVYCAHFINWADKLMQHLKSSQPVTAVRLASEYYERDDNLGLVGLGDDHKQVVSSALPDIILASVGYTIRFNVSAIDELLDACLDALVCTQVDLVQQIYDLVEGSEYELLYLHKLQILSLENKVRYLPPDVFQQMVKHLADNHVETLRQLLLTLDTATLDVNLAFEVCKRYKMRDVELFLYVCALRDFTTPLEQPALGAELFTFLSYSLTGRVYPTGVPMDRDTHSLACREIFQFMIQNHDGLERLIKADARRFFAAMDEAFEQSYFNENEFSRQTLITTFRKCSPSTPFNIFVAWNAPKYRQFLVFTGTELAKTLGELCNEPSEEKERAAVSLLPLLQMDVEHIVLQLTEAGYFEALEMLYVSRRRYIDLMKTLLSHIKSPKAEYGLEFWARLELAISDPRSIPLLIAESQLVAERDPRGFAEFIVTHKLSGAYEHTSDMSEGPKFEFLWAAAQLERLPSSNSLELLRLLAVRKSPQILEYVDSMDYEDEKAEVLKENEQHAALVRLLSSSRPNEAMDVLLEHLPLENSVSEAVHLCMHAADTNLSTGQELWVRLLVALVEHKQELEEPLSHLLQWSLEHGLDTSVVQRAKSTELAKCYLDTINKQLMFVGAARRLGGASAAQLAEIADRQSRGWTFCAEGECETCGERLCGIGVLADKVYGDWEQRRRGNPSNGSRLVLFQCTHIYHERCLLKYGGVECTVCPSPGPGRPGSSVKAAATVSTVTTVAMAATAANNSA